MLDGRKVKGYSPSMASEHRHYTHNFSGPSVLDLAVCTKCRVDIGHPDAEKPCKGTSTHSSSPAPLPATPTQTAAFHISTLRSISDEIDAHNDALKDLGKRWDETERLLMASMDAQGLTESGAKVSTDQGTATRGVKWFVQYEPEKWPTIVAWAVENGRTDFIQRRTSDAKILEAIDSGASLPEGITVGSKEVLNFRRK